MSKQREVDDWVDVTDTVDDWEDVTVEEQAAPQSSDIPMVTEDLQPIPPEPYQFQKDSPFVSQDPKQLLNATSPPQPSGYEIDGKPLSREEFKSRLHDDDFVEQLQTGNAQLSFPQDEEMEALITRQRDAGSRTQDKWDWVMNGANLVGAGVTGMENFMFDLVREGLAPLGVDLPKSYQELRSEWASKEFIEQAKAREEKTRVYERDFFQSIANGDYVDAADQSLNMISQSLALALVSAATAGAGTAATIGTVAGVSASSTYADMNEDEQYDALMGAEKLGRSTAYGVFEGVGAVATGVILAKNLNLVKIGLKNTVKKAAEVGGTEAAQAVAVELGKKVPIQMFKEFGVDILKEGGSETVTELGQMFTDDLMGIKNYTAGDYIYNGLQAGALGAVGGSVMGLPTAGMGIKRYADERLKKNKGEDLKARVEQRVKDGVYTQSEADKIIVAVDNRVEAVNSVPDEMVSNTEVVDLVNQKQDLEKETIDPVLAPIQNAKIKAIDVQIQEKVAPILEAQAEMDEIMKEVEAEKKKKGEEKAMNRKLKLYDILKDETLDPVERRIIKAKKEIVEEKITKKEDSEVPLQKEVVAEKTVSETKPDPLEELDRQLKEMDEAEIPPAEKVGETKITENVKEEKVETEKSGEKNEVLIPEIKTEKIEPKIEKPLTGKVIEPNRGVSASKAVAIKEVVEKHGLTEMEGGILHSLKDADGGQIQKILDGEGLKAGIAKKLDEKGFFDISEETLDVQLSEKAKQFIGSVDARYETRKAVKAGTDLFPKEAGIPDAEFQKRKAAKDKVDAATEKVIEVAKKLHIISSDPTLSKNSFVDLEKAIRLVGEAIKKGIDIHGDVKRAVEEAIDRFKQSNFYKKLNPESQAEVEKSIRSEHEPKVEAIPEAGEVKKTLVTHRAYEGEFRESVKKKLEQIGLTREIDTFASGEAKAKELIDSVGEEAALDAVRNGDVQGSAAAYVFSKIVESTDKKISETKDPAEVERLSQIQADLLNEWGKKQHMSGGFNAAMADILENSDLGYNVEKKIQDYKDLNKGEIPKETEEKFRELDRLIKEEKAKRVVAEERAKVAEEKAEEEIEKQVEEEVNKIIEGLYKKLPSQRRQKADRAIAALEDIQKRLRGRVYDATIGLPVALLDAGISVIKRAIRAGVGIADAIEQGINHIKSKHSEWEKEDQFRKDLLEEFAKEKIDSKKEKTDEQYLDAYKKRAQRRVDELREKIRTKNFEKRKKRDIVADSELTKINAEILRLKGEYDKEFYKSKLQNRTIDQRLIDGLWDAWGLTRALRATGEWSFVGIQGLTLTIRNLIRNPIGLANAFKTAAKTMVSEKATEQFLNEIKSQDYFPELKKSKLSLTEPHAEITARDELFFSDYANLLWNMVGTPLRLIKNPKAYNFWKNLSPFKAFERAAVGYLDTLRVMRFLEGRDMLRKKKITFEDNPQAYKDMADVINTFTGRASLGVAEYGKTATTLTKIFFSPRLWASAIKTATPYAFIHFGKMGMKGKGESTLSLLRKGSIKPSVAQKMAIMDFTTQVVATTGLLMLVKAHLDSDDKEDTGVETDPRSSDFMKIRLGDTRIDPWGGKIQQIILTARLFADVMDRYGLAEGAIKKQDGSIHHLGEPFKTPTATELFIEMATNKLAPTAGLLEQRASSRENKDGTLSTKYGDPYEFSEELKNSLYPIYWETIKELSADGYDVADALLTFYAFFGGGVNTQKKKEKKEQKKQQVIPAAF